MIHPSASIFFLSHGTSSPMGALGEMNSSEWRNIDAHESGRRQCGAVALKVDHAAQMLGVEVPGLAALNRANRLVDGCTPVYPGVHRPKAAYCMGRALQTPHTGFTTRRAA